MLRDRLSRYWQKRDFEKTAEPSGRKAKAAEKNRGLSFLVQKHDASRLHYDFRLEHDGVLLSWACPKGPSFNPNDKRLAVHVEDHPLDYGDFEGTIPKGQYGGGTVMLWDRGTWAPHQDDVGAALKKGKLSFELHGERLRGNWALVRLRARPGDKGDNWLLIKEKDEHVRTKGKLITETEVTSIKTGRKMDEIAKGSDVWQSNRAEKKTGKKTGKSKAGNEKKSKAQRSEVGAQKIPPFIEPQLATLVDVPADGREWLHEIKYDGYRTLASIGGDNVVIRTRSGLDWTDKFAPLVAPLRALPCDSALLDGEIAVADADGHTDFGALQNALSLGSGGFGYYVFDLLHLNGEDLRKRPLVERKKRLAELLKTAPAKGPLTYSDHVLGDGDKVFHHACDLRLEGIISKRADDPYRSGRTKSWLKTKCGMAQEFVIIGWQPSDKAGRPFSSILLAVREDGDLRYAGRVGSGFNDALLDDLAEKFERAARNTPPVEDVPRAIARHAHFIEPVLVAEIALRGWTREGLVRQGSFKGLRGDKPVRSVVRERPMPTAKAVKKAKVDANKSAKGKTSARRALKPADDENGEIAGVRVTHPDRVVYPGQGVTKRELAEYYLEVADRMLPHIAGRPLALVRCPRGSEKDCFFQKHANPGWPDLFRKVRIKEKSGSADYLYIEDERGLIAAAQMGVLELHLWGSHQDDVEHPDRMVFDLDPDEGLGFAEVKHAARDVKKRLEDVGLKSLPMVTGGKGVHVVVPLKRKHTWDEHRNFAEALARVMVEEEPERFVAVMSKAKRRGKIFLDYLRNQRGSTAIAPYSTRARPGAFVAWPVSWADLGKLKDAHPVSVENFKQKIASKADAWSDYAKIRQSLPLGRRS